MPSYSYKARDHSGASIRGVETASDEVDLDRRLAERDLVLIDAKPAPVARGRSAPAQTLIDFCFHLSIVLEAGVPLVAGLRDLRDQKLGDFEDVVSDLIVRVEGGESFSDAIRHHPDVFPGVLGAIVSAGESSGQLDRVLRDLVGHLEWRHKLSRDIRSAMSYPIVVILGVVALIAIVIFYVLPRFLVIFTEVGVELPAPTRVLLAIQQFGSSHGVTLASALCVTGVLGYLYVRTPVGRVNFDRMLLRIPLLGDLLSMIEAARFSHNLGLLYSAGLPVPRCLELIQEIVQNAELRIRVREAAQAIERGESISDAIAAGDFMPRMIVRMVSIGVVRGRIDQAMERAAAYYDREVPLVIAKVLAVFNTGAVIALGVTVVSVALAVFLPIYTMMGQLNAVGK